jgi:hypothetical protein
MISAQEAKRRSLDVSEAEAAKILSTCENAINASIHRGERSCYVDSISHPAVLAELERLGYKANTCHDQRDGGTTISW